MHISHYTVTVIFKTNERQQTFKDISSIAIEDDILYLFSDELTTRIPTNKIQGFQFIKD